MTLDEWLMVVTIAFGPMALIMLIDWIDKP